MPQGNVIIVTGAGSGVGRATSLMLSAMGYDLVLVGRTREKLDKTVELAGDTDSQFLVLDIDLAHDSAAKWVIDEAVSEFNRVDGIVNSAGIAPLTAIDEITPDLCNQCLAINLEAIVNLTAAVWPIMQKQQSGIFVNISSLASIDPFPNFSVYAASKIAVNMFTSCVAKEGAEFGIKAVTIAPGAIETPMFRSLFSEEQYPKAKTLAPEDVAEVVCDCISGGRTFQPGEVIELPNP